MPCAGDPYLALLDQHIDRLRAPTTVHDRLDVLRHLVNFWHGPIRPEDGMSDEELGGVSLPLPLQWWYRWAGKRVEIMSGQNFLFAPRNSKNKYRILAVQDGRLRFYVENQGVYQWSTLPGGDDPPVFGRYTGQGRWAKEQITLSEHLILTCLLEAIMSHANCRASAAWLPEEKLHAIGEHIEPLAIRPWRWMQARFFARQGAFMCAAPNDEVDGTKGYSVWIGAKTASPLQFMKAHVNERWEYVAL